MSDLRQVLLSGIVIAASICMVACGSSGTSSNTGGAKFSGNTSVKVLLSSTANDQLSQFNLTLQSLTLTDQAGNIASVLSGEWPAEFIHVNGAIEPLVTVTLPQGVYTSATAVIGSANFTCLTVQPQDSPDAPGSLTQSVFAYGYTPNANVTVNLPSPITITGSSMGLVLNLQVAQSASYPSTCYIDGIEPFAITPTFNLVAAGLAANPTNPTNGKVTQLEGTVAALGATGSTLTLDLGEPFQPQRVFSVASDSNTVYEGVSGFPALQVGTLLDLDGAVQSDGSILATRIAGYDPAALNEMIGPLLQLPASVPDFYSFAIEQQGQTYSTQPQSLGIYTYANGPSFQISDELTNLGDLPFVASFKSSNMVTGQNVAIFSQQITDYYGGQYTPATTITLMPQTINGSVVASTPAGNFTDYTVSLASYDLFPTLAIQPDAITVLNNPSFVEVYVDGSTQKLNTQALASGNTLRFYGLVFNDNGTLRMDCAQVSDGVTGSSTSGSGTNYLEAGRTTVQQRGSGTHPIRTMITRAHEN